MEKDYKKLEDNLIVIATEMYRFQSSYDKMLMKLPITEQSKYKSQFNWFSKRVSKALEDSNLKLVSLQGQEYDVGMAVTPLNIEEFEVEDKLFIQQMVEPIIMKDSTVCKVGTVVLGRIEE